MTQRQLEIAAFALAYLDAHLVEAVSARQVQDDKKPNKPKFRPPSGSEIAATQRAIVGEMK